MVDADRQRFNMVESQVRPSDVTDRRIIRAMTAVPRHEFVPPSLRAIAYVDGPLPVALDGQGRPRRDMMAPRVFAKLLQAAAIPDAGSVLLAGCATGYGVAVVAHVAKTVVGVEPDPALAELARGTLARLGIDNATIVCGPIADGSNSHAPFDAIILEGAVRRLPEALFDQLKDGGRLVGVRLDGRVGTAVVARRSGRVFDERSVFDAAAPLLPGDTRQTAFAL
jgi:protein-L-isoaspartate(D-aspartate) O-methyltransferase